MPWQQLPADCLNKIFEFLEKDKVALHSSLLVNRLWCEVSVTILWRNIWIVIDNSFDDQHRLKVESSILKTLIACLPNESKTHLNENGILNSTQISKTTLFNYASFCKVLSINNIDQMIVNTFKDQKKHLLTEEIIKMFMKRISSLKELSIYANNSNNLNLSILNYPETKDCLTKLSKLSCNSNIKSDFFDKLSQICNNIQTLTIEFNDIISNDLKNLISSQNNLKSLSLRLNYDMTRDVITSLTKHSETLIKLKINWRNLYWNRKEQTLFITKFTNLQELVLSFHHKECFDGLNYTLQHIVFPQLKNLKFLHRCPEDDVLIKFLENNGKNLKEFYINSSNTLILLAIAEFCSDLKSLYILFKFDKIEAIKAVLNNCQQLECIETQYYYGLLKEKILLEILAKYSQKNFYRLKLHYYSSSQLNPKDLEEFFIYWKNRVQQKLFHFTIIFKYLEYYKVSNLKSNESIKMIEKYKILGNFEIITLNKKIIKLPIQ
ncbi:hypothetical protein RclHR1_00980015 [Rhizophagus clarus]|uniref:F-box domain-containing protein n=1 Tax=Rhizophagus clarus TaxID=94130 RepID=A0A2Z6S5K2_9GLOM|nr:hypothetical protein RclHR1_00980015 [Rhizophagus clarus]GES81166.1 hypothetical protein GLOIN_2v1784405 [Rhizophagus clarus]